MLHSMYNCFAVDLGSCQGILHSEMRCGSAF